MHFQIQQESINQKSNKFTTQKYEIPLSDLQETLKLLRSVKSKCGKYNFWSSYNRKMFNISEQKQTVIKGRELNSLTWTTGHLEASTFRTRRVTYSQSFWIKVLNSQKWNFYIILGSNTFSFFNFYFIHMCIQCFSHFSPLPPPPPLPPFPPQPPQYTAETTLPLSLILLKREYKQ
jgi:hypothetical protein